MAEVGDRVRESMGVVIEVFRSFRGELMEHYGEFEFDRKEGDMSPVTVYDTKLDEAVKARLAAEFPELKYKGEETGQDAEGAYWTIDSIDGTTSYIRGVPNCTNMAAYVDHGEVLAAVIYDFVGDKLYTAVKGEGAWCDGKRLQVFEREQKFEIDMHGRGVFSAVSQLFRWQDVRPFQPRGAAGRWALDVVEGVSDGLMNMAGRGREFDFAPGVLIMLEAGAEIVTLHDGGFSLSELEKPFFIGTKAMAEVVRKNRDRLMEIYDRYFMFQYLEGIERAPESSDDY